VADAEKLLIFSNEDVRNQIQSDIDSLKPRSLPRILNRHSTNKEKVGAVMKGAGFQGRYERLFAKRLVTRQNADLSDSLATNQSQLIN
jgi:hypothetical protein